MQYNTMQYNTMQYDTMQYNTIQYNTIQYNTIKYNAKIQTQYNTQIQGYKVQQSGKLQQDTNTIQYKDARNK